MNKEALLPPRPLDTRWLETLDGQHRKDFEVIVRNSTLLLTRLKGIIEEAERSLHSQSANVKDFDNPNWTHKQAFRLGELAQLRQLKNLIPF